MLRKYLGRKKVVNYPIILWGHSLYISVERRRGAKEQMIVVSNIEFENPLALYHRRWEIETLFGIKSRSYCLYWSLDFVGLIELGTSRPRRLP